MAYIAPPLPIPEWLPDDTEDSIVGAEWHQEAIGAAAQREIDELRRRLQHGQGGA
jgi:hypothetical protein